MSAFFCSARDALPAAAGDHGTHSALRTLVSLRRLAIQDEHGKVRKAEGGLGGLPQALNFEGKFVLARASRRPQLPHKSAAASELNSQVAGLTQRAHPIGSRAHPALACELGGSFVDSRLDRQIRLPIEGHALARVLLPTNALRQSHALIYDRRTLLTKVD